MQPSILRGYRDQNPDKSLMGTYAKETVITASFQGILLNGIRFLQVPCQSTQNPHCGQFLPVNEM